MLAEEAVIFFCERPGEFLHRKTVDYVVVQSAFSSCCFNPVNSRRFFFICLDVWRIPGARDACKLANGSEGGRFTVVHKKRYVRVNGGVHAHLF